MLCVLRRLLPPRAPDYLKETRRARLQRAALRLEVCAPLALNSHVRHQETHHVLVDAPTDDELHGRYPQALAVHIRRHPHRPRRRSTDVRVMRAVGDVEEGLGFGFWVSGRVVL